MKALKYLDNNRPKEPRVYGRTVDGLRFSMSWGIFCDVCDEDITDGFVKGQFICKDCSLHNSLVIAALKTLLLNGKGQPDYSMSIEAKRNLRHAIAYIADRFEYEQYMVTELIKGEMAQVMAVKQALHDRVCNCQAKI